MKEGSSAAPQLHHLPTQTGLGVGSLASSSPFKEQRRHLKEDSGAASYKITQGLAPVKRSPECCLGVSQQEGWNCASPGTLPSPESLARLRAQRMLWVSLCGTEDPAPPPQLQHPGGDGPFCHGTSSSSQPNVINSAIDEPTSSVFKIYSFCAKAS